MSIDVDRVRQAASYAGQWVAYQQQWRDLPGVVVAIAVGDEIVLSAAYGYADLEKQTPMTPDHIFRIASHSKTFTAMAVLQLVERGKLRLDDPIGTYVPAAPEAVKGATIRQLLNHSAGVIRDGQDSDFWQVTRPFPDLDELLDLTEDVFPPNQQFKYSNIGYALVGLAIEAASGMPYNEYTQRHIVERLGLRNTGPELNDAIAGRLVTGYTSREVPPRVPLPNIDTGALSPATGFYSTAGDLCRYGAAHFLGNEELLSDASKREMQQPYWEIAQSDNRYGLGFNVSDIGERRMIGHGGGFPGHSTNTKIDPKDRLVVTVLINETSAPAYLLATSVVRIIDFALRAPDKDATADLDRFVGRFANLWGVSDIAAFGTSLYELGPAADNPVDKNAVTELAVQDPDTLRIEKTGGTGSPGQTIRYYRDEQGNVERIRVGGGTMYPLAAYRARAEAT